MKLTNLPVLALSASLVNARFIEHHETDQVVLSANAAEPELFLVELAPGKTQWVTEDEKWELRRVGLREIRSASAC
jgi:leucyl aminopeptidase